MSFTPEQIEYLAAQPLARLATVGADGHPDVMPVAFELDGDAGLWIAGGQTALRTRKLRNILAGRREVALVVDDMPSFQPFIARGIRIYGVAADPVERVGMIGPGHYTYVTPTISWSWNLVGDPVGEEWYPAERREHAGV